MGARVILQALKDDGGWMTVDEIIVATGTTMTYEHKCRTRSHLSRMRRLGEVESRQDPTRIAANYHPLMLWRYIDG